MLELEELERRVTAKFLAAAHARYPDAVAVFDPAGWDESIDPVQWNQPHMGLHAARRQQFPRQQLVTYPTRRLMILLLVDRSLDLELTDEQWAQVSWLMTFGGRVAV